MGLSAVTRAIILGMGKQKYGALVLFLTAWVITLPLSAIWVIALGKGIMEVLLTRLGGSVLNMILLGCVVIFTDWEKLTAEIQARLNKNT